MRNHLCLSFGILLLFGPSIFGQASPASECPKLEVVGPRGLLIAGESATFVLQTDQDFPESFRYEWSIENGTIVKGQGTRVVEITSMAYGASVRATATVTGLAAGCPNSASEVAGVMQHLEWEILDEWGEMPNDDQRGRLDLFFAELSNNPTHKGLIVIMTKDKNAERTRLRLVLDHVRFRKFDKSLLVFCMERSGFTSTKIYRFPPQLESEIPYPGCKLISGVLLK